MCCFDLFKNRRLGDVLSLSCYFRSWLDWHRFIHVFELFNEGWDFSFVKQSRQLLTPERNHWLTSPQHNDTNHTTSTNANNLKPCSGHFNRSKRSQFQLERIRETLHLEEAQRNTRQVSLSRRWCGSTNRKKNIEDNSNQCPGLWNLLILCISLDFSWWHLIFLL